MRSDPDNAAHPVTASEDVAALTNGDRLRGPVRVFLCYRRKDARCSALRLYDWLERSVGRDNVFIDFVSIGGGEVFPEVIEQRVTASDVVLAVVGPNWLTAARPGQEDFVVLEIATALRNRVPVIPVFVDDATMPDPAVFPNELVLRGAGVCAVAPRCGPPGRGLARDPAHGGHVGIRGTRRGRARVPVGYGLEVQHV
jgi:hypothetical protein